MNNKNEIILKIYSALKANSYSATVETPIIYGTLWYMCPGYPDTCPILSQINPLYTLTYSSFKTYFNIILQSVLVVPYFHVSPVETSIALLFSFMLSAQPIHPHLFDHSNSRFISVRIQIMLFIMLFYPSYSSQHPPCIHIKLSSV
jgi:hypothetical protein